MPHHQLSDLGDLTQAQRLVEVVAALPGVRVGRSKVSDPRSIAFHLREDLIGASDEEAPIGGEFAHVHPYDGGSQHLVLPPAWGGHVIDLGWAELHPLARDGVVPPLLYLVYGPRDDTDTLHITAITRSAYAHIRGISPDDL
jgi:hypothetical protein